MKTTIWQQMTEHDLTFVAQAQLLLGPQDCARLDMTIHTARTTTQHLVVSDGHALAQCTKNGKQPDDVQGLSFPRTMENLEPAKQNQHRESFLREKGCGGPRAVLLNLTHGMTEIQVDTGLWRGQPVLRFQGVLVDPQAAPAHVCGYLHAETLWPLRLEWRRQGRKGLTPSPYLQMEFRDPVLNQPLTPEECDRAFTFQPERE